MDHERTRPDLLTYEEFIGDPHPRADPTGWRMLTAGLMIEPSKDTARTYWLVLKTEVTAEQWNIVVRRALDFAERGGPAWFPKTGYLRQLSWEVKDEILSRRALAAGKPQDLPPVSEEEAARIGDFLRKAARGQDPMAVVRQIPKAAKGRQAYAGKSAAELEERKRKLDAQVAENRKRFPRTA